MTEFGIITLDREGVCFTIRDCIPAIVIPEQTIGFKAIAEIELGLWGLVHQGLDALFGSFPGQFQPKMQRVLRSTIVIKSILFFYSR